jgi:hypothetical protein
MITESPTAILSGVPAAQAEAPKPTVKIELRIAVFMVDLRGLGEFHVKTTSISIARNRYVNKYIPRNEAPR